ncbi:hypothetical protein VW41_22540 [Klebsiella michiganensis]|nr:hypothetical protein VW41_22540 [Klebsiella michiganensis]
MKLSQLVLLGSLLSAAGYVQASPAGDPLTPSELTQIKQNFSELITLANRHDVNAIHAMFWQSPSALIVAKSAVPADGNWAGYWGNEAIDRKIHDIAASGPVVLTPDFNKLKVVGLTQDVAQSYLPMNITVSYAGQSGTPKPFLMMINWLKVNNAWKIAAEIILPVPVAASPVKKES